MVTSLEYSYAELLAVRERFGLLRPFQCCWCGNVYCLDPVGYESPDCWLCSECGDPEVPND
jgi:hypothetical protein